MLLDSSMTVKPEACLEGFDSWRQSNFANEAQSNNGYNSNHLLSHLLQRRINIQHRREDTGKMPVYQHLACILSSMLPPLPQILHKTAHHDKYPYQHNRGERTDITGHLLSAHHQPPASWLLHHRLHK